VLVALARPPAVNDAKWLIKAIKVSYISQFFFLSVFSCCYNLSI